MDGLSPLPPEAPLRVVSQSWRGVPMPRRPGAPAPWRAPVLAASMLLTAGTVGTFAWGLRAGGLGGAELVLLALMGVTFFWIAFAAAASLAGAAALGRAAPMPPPGPRQRVALLMPVMDEDPEAVLGAARAMAADLPARHDWAVFVLSDTPAGDVALRERAAAALPAAVPLYWRHRIGGTAKKAGNVMEWVSRWGADWDGFVVLDADSLMTGGTLGALADALRPDPGAGLVHTAPRLVGGETLFARLQSFATATYGTPLAAGLAAFAGGEGNYWGHNAIVRTRAFAASAALPAMPRLAGGGLVLSHDFVEAGLLRRAGWSVRFAPTLGGSWEAPPATLAEHLRRDRRWCHGNLQHLALLGARGLHPISRFHLFAGAMAYLAAPAWLMLLTIWALVGNGAGSVILHFTPENPIYPVWPETAGVGGPAALAFFYGMLMLPKVVGLALVPRPLRRAGLLRDAALEIAASLALAPILMVQQTRAVARTLMGLRMGWGGGRAARPRWRDLARLHAAETALGFVLGAAILAGHVSGWLWPIAAPLALAIPISRLSGARMGEGALATAETLDPPPLLAAARAEAEALRAR